MTSVVQKDIWLSVLDQVNCYWKSETYKWRTRQNTILCSTHIILTQSLKYVTCWQHETKKLLFYGTLRKIFETYIFLKHGNLSLAPDHVFLRWNNFILYTFNVVIYIDIIILLCHQHGYPWPSLATPPYRSSLLASPQGYVPYPHRATACRFKLVALLLLGHVRGP